MPQPKADLALELHAASIRLLRRVRLADAAAGLSAPKLSALSVLVFAGPMSLSQLAAAEQVKPPTMSKQVADLEAEGLIAKRADANDRRGITISATAKGRRLMEHGRARRLAIIRAGLSRLSPAERDILAAAVPLIAKVATGAG